MFLANQIKLRGDATWRQFHTVMLDDIDPSLTEDQHRIIDYKSRAGHSAALEINGDILFAAGLFVMSKESPEVWAVINPKLKHKYPILLTRKIIELLDIYAISDGLSSVFMFVESARIEAQAWAYALGFFEAGEVLMYDRPDADVLIYRKDFHGSGSTLGCGDCNHQDGIRRRQSA